MKKILLFVGIIAILGVAIVVSQKKENTNARIGAPEQAQTDDGRPLYTLSEKQESLQDFVLGASYIFGSLQSPEQWVFEGYKDDISGLFAVFSDGENNARIFGSTLLISVSSDNEKESRKIFEKDDSVQSFEFLPQTGIFVLHHDRPFHTYLGYLRYLDNPLFDLVSLDFEVTTMQDEGIGI